METFIFLNQPYVWWLYAENYGRFKIPRNGKMHTLLYISLLLIVNAANAESNPDPRQTNAGVHNSVLSSCFGRCRAGVKHSSSAVSSVCWAGLNGNFQWGNTLLTQAWPWCADLGLGSVFAKHSLSSAWSALGQCLSNCLGVSPSTIICPEVYNNKYYMYSMVGYVKNKGMCVV